MSRLKLPLAISILIVLALIYFPVSEKASEILPVTESAPEAHEKTEPRALKPSAPPPASNAESTAPDPPGSIADPVPSLTSTAWTPWLDQLHLTTPEQLAAGYKGGEGWQGVWCMDISPSDPQKLVLGVDTSGIWKSVDGGVSWKCSNVGFNAICAYALAFDPENADIIYALGGSAGPADKSIFPETAGIYRSDDGGDSWRLLHTTMMTRQFTSKLIGFGTGPYEKKPVFIGTQADGLLASVDGIHFYGIDTLSGTGIISDVKASGKQIIIATEHRGVMVSEDGGLTWAARNTGISSPVAYGGALSVAVNPADESHWFCIAGNAVYQTHDSGKKWTRLKSADSLLGGSGDVTHQQILFSADTEDGSPPRLYLSMGKIGHPVRVSFDYGEIWIKPELVKTLAYNPLNTGYYSEAFTVHPTDADRLWGSWNCEIYRSDDGGITMTPSSSGFSGVNANRILFDKNDPWNIYISAIDFGISRSVPSTGPSGTDPNAYPAFEYLSGSSKLAYKNALFSAHGVARDPADPLHLFSSVGNWTTSCMMESFDGGDSWETAGDYEAVNTNSIIMALQYHESDHSFIYAGKYYSRDNGRSWRMNNGGFTISAISPADNDYVFSVATQRYISVSRDRGQTWLSLTAEQVSADKTFLYATRRIVPDMRDINVIWLVRYSLPLLRLEIDWETGKVTGYREYGEAEGLVTNSRGRFCLWDIAQNPRDPSHMIAGGADYVYMLPGPGFFESTDGGNSWRMIEGMQGTRDVRLIEFHPTLPQVWMGTSAGVWIYKYDQN